MEFENQSFEYLSLESAGLHSIEVASSENPYILAQVGTHQVAFPAESIANVLLVERSHLLVLPFYREGVMGIVHHQGQLITLFMLQLQLEGFASPSREVFNAVQLSEESGLPGLGLMVDRLLGNRSEEQVNADTAIEVFQLQWLEADLWKPQRWQPLAR